MINVNVVTSSPTTAHQLAIPMGENGLLVSEPSLSQQILDLHKADKKPGSVARILLGQNVALIVGVGSSYKPKDFAAAAVRGASAWPVQPLRQGLTRSWQVQAVIEHDAQRTCLDDVALDRGQGQLQLQRDIVVFHPADLRQQERALEILQFKLDVLWSMSDAIALAYPDKPAKTKQKKQ